MYTKILHKHNPYIKQLKKNLPAAFHVYWEDIISKNKSRNITDARAAFAYCLYNYWQASQSQIAATIGIKQAAVSKLLKKHQDLIQFDENYKQKFALFLHLLE